MVGAGHIANTWSDAFAASGHAELVAVADPCLPAARRIASRHGAAAHSDHRRTLDQVEADALLVCTPPASHAEIVFEALDRGLGVLCEKPLCTDLASAEILVERARLRGRPLMLASKFRYVEDVARARELLLSGHFGRLRRVENAFTTWVDMTGRWYADPAVSGGGVLIDNGTHSADLFRYLLGPLTEVLAVADPNLQPLEVEDTVRLFARNADGVTAHADLSWSLDPRRPTFLELYGSDGCLEIGWRSSRIRDSDGPWRPFGAGYDKGAAFVRMLEDFCGALDGKTPSSTPDDALASVAVIQTAYEALEQGSWQRVSAPTVAPRRQWAIAR